MLVRDSTVGPNVATYAVMLNDLCELGKFLEVIEMRSRVVRNGHRKGLFTYSWPAWFSQCGVGLAFFAEMIKPGLVTDVVTCNSLLNGFCKAGRLQELLKL